MNINEQVARRRAELKQQEKQIIDDQRAAETTLKVAEQAQREAVIEELAAELTASGLPVSRENDALVMESAPPPPIDVDGLKRTAIARLLDREVRNRWTPGDNWLIIGLIVGGVTLLHLGGIGVVPLFIGLWRRGAINRRIRADVLALYPQFAPPTP